MEVINIEEYQNEIILHFGSGKNSINAYTLASSIVSIADALKEANSVINPGHEIEILVHSFSEGSFRVTVRTVYKSIQNLFSAENLKAITLGVLAAFVFEHTLASDTEVKVIVDETQVVIEQGDKKIIVPRAVYDAQKELEKSEKFRKKIARTFETIEKDTNITSFGLTNSPEMKKPQIEIPRENFSILSVEAEPLEEKKVNIEVADLQIKKAILERSKRKWEFVWRGVKISAPVLDDSFYDDFFAHKITIAPGDLLKGRLKIYQSLEADTGIYLNDNYEVIEVYEHVPRLRQSIIDLD